MGVHYLSPAERCQLEWLFRRLVEGMGGRWQRVLRAAELVEDLAVGAADIVVAVEHLP